MGSKSVQGSDNAVARQVTIAQIRKLPRVEQITQLNCIEGWTVVAHWAGARFADFTQGMPRSFATPGMSACKRRIGPIS
jgi:DMSO/TMAO reductase YedYZ molybdopterin-dependent catalytic subunit